MIKNKNLFRLYFVALLIRLKNLLQKLNALEKEEELREQAGYYNNEDSDEDEEMKEIRGTAAMQVTKKRKTIKKQKSLD